MSEEQIVSIVKPLGLSDTRYTYVRSMIDFIEQYDEEIKTLPNDELIYLIADNVKGASYKVAQCCVLYIRNYYCGIMPVDSGMKEVLLPCLGFDHHKGSKGHETARKEVEALVEDLDLRLLLAKGNYGDLNIPEDGPLTWWAHLVMIYYKRHYCNKRKHEECLINKELKLSSRCEKK